MTAYSEETQVVNFGGGLYSADLPSAIPDGFCATCDNVVPTGTSLESRYGLKYTTVSYHEQSNNHLKGLGPFLTQLGGAEDATLPIMMWGDKKTSQERIHMLRDNTRYTAGSGTVSNGYFYFNTSYPFRGSVNYNNRIYYAHSNGVQKITAINWSTPSVTESAVSSAPTGVTCGLIQFLDRLWVGVGSKLYFTDPPSSPGGFPETWSTSTNFIPCIGSHGPGVIKKVIPLGSRLYIFTTAGLFSLSVLGTTADWYLRIVDQSAKFNTPECAFEKEGIIYYITDTGVYAMNGSDAVKVSGSIGNYFLAGNFGAEESTGLKKASDYRINYLDGGMLISISEVVLHSGDPYFNKDNCFNFYSRLDSVAWSSWNYSSDDSEPTAVKLGAVVAIQDSIKSYLNTSPLTFALVYNVTNGEGVATSPVLELVTYDGFQDQGHTTEADTFSLNIQSLIESRYFEGGGITDIKTLKYAFLDLFLPERSFYYNKDSSGNFTKYYGYSWGVWNDELGPTYDPPEAISGDPSVSGQEFSVIRIEAGFAFRIAQFRLYVNSTDNCNFKIRNLFLKAFTERDVTEYVS